MVPPYLACRSSAPALGRYNGCHPDSAYWMLTLSSEWLWGEFRALAPPAFTNRRLSTGRFRAYYSPSSPIRIELGESNKMVENVSM